MSISIPPKGTHFSDGVRVGPEYGSLYKAGNSVLSNATQVASPTDSATPGIYMTPTSLVDFVPAPVAAASLRAAATIAAAGYLTLITTNSINQQYVPAPGIFPGTVPAQVNPAYAIQLDCPRNITWTAAAGAAACIVTIWGWDQYEQPMVETRTTTAGGVGGATTTFLKAFKWISAIYSSAGTGADTVSIGVGNIFGLPYYLQDANYMFSQNYNGALDAGTITIGDPEVATAATGDVRGTYTPASNADAVKRLTLNFYNSSGDIRKYNNAGASTVYLANNALTGGAVSTVITVTAQGHNFVTGEYVTISGGTTTVNGILPANYNITAPVTVVNENSFTYNATGAAGGGGGSGGGTTIQMTPGQGVLYSSAVGRYGVAQYTVKYT